ADGVLKAMFFTKLATAVVVLFSVVVLATGAGVLTHQALAVKREAPADKSQLTDKQMDELAAKTVHKDHPKATLSPLASTNPHLGGERKIANPFKNYRFWCANLGFTPAAPIRSYLGIDRSGKVYYPFRAEQFSALLAGEDLLKWTEDDLLNAAQLYVHLTG